MPVQRRPTSRVRLNFLHEGSSLEGQGRCLWRPGEQYESSSPLPTVAPATFSEHRLAEPAISEEIEALFDTLDSARFLFRSKGR
jgi:hypothetical protein